MKVLITGGAGFLGRAILQADPFNGAEFIVASRDETKQEAIRRRWPDVRTVLADVRDERAIEPLMYGVDYVIHAAAVKYVDWAEDNVHETIDVNIRGTDVVLRAAARAGVTSVVVVSTDKATAPLNTYGSTKQLAERLVGEYARSWTNTRFVACRYGNVVGSTGSVTWKWSHAIERGEPVTVTDGMMTRFWLAPSDAVAVIRRTMDAMTGTVVIPYAPAMAMRDVATAMGAREIKEIGLRPGERMDEMLLSDEEAPRAIDAGEYMMLRPAYERGRANGISGYDSSDPKRWLSAADMVAMVAEARSLWA